MSELEMIEQILILLCIMIL